MINETVYLTRACAATRVPQGDTLTLEKDSPVNINQALGNSVTVTAPGGMFRLGSESLDALGEECYTWVKSEQERQRAAEAALEGPFGEGHVWAALKQCFDPEIPVNIVDLGLIYSLIITPLEGSENQHRVDVKMTLTAPGCGMGPVIAADAQDKIETLPGVGEANVSIVWEPQWHPSMISEEGRSKLGLNEE